jgi:hypothetical protein
MSMVWKQDEVKIIPGIVYSEHGSNHSCAAQLIIIIMMIRTVENPHFRRAEARAQWKPAEPHPEKLVHAYLGKKNI